MPIGAISMILTNVGLQIFNNWCSSRQNNLLQQKREDFEMAARERNTQRMWQIMREGQELTRQLEEEKHQQRLEELKNDIGSLLQKLAYTASINNWPLNVLPIVMKNQALGNLLANQEECIALHCIFTPSNNAEFNRTVFPHIEEALETYCNQHWSVMSDHPILFYSGAWKSQQAPTEVHIDSMRTALSNLPTLVITPFFRPNDGMLVFHVRIWGVGALSSDEFSIPEIEPMGFQRDYNSFDELNDGQDLLDEMIEDFVPYLQCLIGYISDTFFWSSSALRPHLPRLISDGIINTDGMKYLVNDSRDYYNKLFLNGKLESKENPFMNNNLLTLYEGSAVLWNEETRMNKLIEVFLSYANNRSGKSCISMHEAMMSNLYSKDDLPFIKTCISKFTGSEYEQELKHIASIIESVDFDYNILEFSDVDFLKIKSEGGEAAASYRLGEIYEFSIGTKWDKNQSDYYYAKAAQENFILSILRECPELVDYYAEEIECMANSGVAYAIILKAKRLIDNGNINDAIKILGISTFHPAVELLKAELLLYHNNNPGMAERYLIVAADCGYIKAIEKLCELYHKGEYLSENPSKHASYAEKAMLQNSPYGTYAMALCYLNGYGTQQSTKVGMMLIDKAVELGWDEAKRIKNFLNAL